MPGIHFDLATNSVEDSYYDITSNSHLRTQAPLEVIAREDYQDAIAFQKCCSYSPQHDPFVPSASVDYEQLSLDNAAALAEHHTIFDNPKVSSSDPSPHPPPASSIFSPGARGMSSETGSSSKLNSRNEKRKANTLAARRYRQNRLDKAAELESVLKATQLERDELKMRVAKLEGETQVLKDIVAGKRATIC